MTESLSRFPKLVAKRNLDGLESIYYDQAREWAGRSLARKIGEVDLIPYQAALSLGLAEAGKSAEEHKAKAVYFECDMENGWNGRFFVCECYAPESAKDEDWADERVEEFEGPGIPEFGGFYRDFGFDRTDQAKGVHAVHDRPDGRRAGPMRRSIRGERLRSAPRTAARIRSSGSTGAARPDLVTRR